MWQMEVSYVTCPTTCLPLMKASNPQTAAHSVNGKTYLASMGAELRLVYFWKMTTLEGEKGRNKPVNSGADLHPDAFWVNFSLTWESRSISLHLTWTAWRGSCWPELSRSPAVTSSIGFLTVSTPHSSGLSSTDTQIWTDNRGTGGLESRSLVCF